MGMYTELSMRCELKKDVPQYVIDTLKLMLDHEPSIDETDWPKETIGVITGRQKWMLLSASYYLHPFSKSFLDYDPMTRTYFLSTLFNIKNYDKEIEGFIEWLTPFIDANDGTFLGYRLYEEGNTPQLLFHPNKWSD